MKRQKEKSVLFLSLSLPFFWPFLSKFCSSVSLSTVSKKKNSFAHNINFTVSASKFPNSPIFHEEHNFSLFIDQSIFPPEKVMEFPKLNEVNQMEETKNSQKISVCSQSNGVHYTTNPDSFVIDMNGGTKESSANSRITRNFSRKGSQRGGDKMIATNSAPKDRDSSSSTVAAVGATMAEKSAAVAVAVGSQQDHLGVPQVHHQIIITTGNTVAPVERGILRRNSFRRATSSWFLDPKKVLLFFATVSCIGSMVLIYCTLAIGKPNADEQALG